MSRITLFVMASLCLATEPVQAQEHRERAAILYAHDQQALYRIEPNTGESTKIGDFAYDWGNPVYDPTVPLYPELYRLAPLHPASSERVYNVGRMHNRQIGIVAGIGFSAAGIALLFLPRRASS